MPDSTPPADADAKSPAPPDQAQAREAADNDFLKVSVALDLLMPAGVPGLGIEKRHQVQEGCLAFKRLGALLTSPVPAQEDVTGDELAELADYAVSMFMAASAEASAYDADQFTKRGHEALALIRTGNPAAIRAALAKLKEGTDGQ